MEKIKYGVVILNYRTANDAIKAAISIVEYSKGNNYKICIVDGGSNSENDEKVLTKCSIQNTHVLLLKDNKGYAVGNNAGIRYLISNYDIEYLVVMNPDVLLIENATIEDIIHQVEEDDELVGGQPLVWTVWKNTSANEQINIRRVFDYFDCVIESFFIFKRIFVKRYKRNVYLDRIPYLKPIKYEVPSGAFFILNRATFENIGLFDERTFLYNEELILGHKINKLGKKMILVPGHKVIHESGKSTGSNANRISKFAFSESQKSLDIYMRDCLKVSNFKKMIVLLLGYINFKIKEIRYLACKM